MLLDDDRNFVMVAAVTGTESLMAAIAQHNPTDVVVCENVLEEYPAWDIGVHVIGYVLTDAGMGLISRYGIDSYGKISSESELLDAMENDRIIQGTGAMPGQTAQSVDSYNPQPQKNQNPETTQPQGTGAYGYAVPGTPYGQMPQNAYMPGYAPMAQNPYMNVPPSNGSTIPNQYAGAPGMWMPYQQGYYQPVNPSVGMPYQQGGQMSNPNYQGMYTGTGEIPKQAQELGGYGVNMPPVYAEGQPVQQANAYRSITDVREDNAAQIKEQLSQSVKKDYEGVPQKTKVISSYSAKGGIGKTSIAKEVATYLACTSNGERHYRVCIADFNIDFGDVVSVLDYDTNAKGMMHWIQTIRAKLVKLAMDRGIDAATADKEVLDNLAEEMRFTKDEIFDFLQKKEDTGLYALTAPIDHEDTMDIKMREIWVMLKSLKECGEFDYIICDTGNNTRDSTFTALEQSDLILFLNTQDVTTANDNEAFLSAMKKIGFDESRIKLVINMIRPESQTGISIKEIEECFPFECIGRIKYDTDVIKANNKGKALVTEKGKTEFTRQIQEIVEHITGAKCSNAQPEKKRFGGLFWKKQ